MPDAKWARIKHDVMFEGVRQVAVPVARRTNSVWSSSSEFSSQHWGEVYAIELLVYLHHHNNLLGGQPNVNCCLEFTATTLASSHSFSPLFCRHRMHDIDVGSCQWRSQGLEEEWAQRVWGRKSLSGVQGQSPSEGLGRIPQKPNMHVQSAVDKHIFMMCS